MRAAALLLVLCLGLGALVAHRITRGSAEGPPGAAPSAGPAAARPPLPRIAHPDKGAYARVVADNLFDPARRPTVEAAKPPRPGPRRPAAALPGFELKGVVITPEGRSALIKLRRERAYRKVVQGETVEGWVIHAIAADNISVKKAGASTVLELKTPPSARRPAKSARPAAMPGPSRAR